MINAEDHIRNQRNNWFLASQGLIFAGECSLLSSDNMIPKELLIMIGSLGMIMSVAFMYAAWRSEKAISMAIACWDIFLKDHNKKISDYPPVNLITKGIIGSDCCFDNTIGINEWNMRIGNQMYSSKSSCRKCMDEKLNRHDYFMPFKMMPLLFCIYWLGHLYMIIF